MHTTKAIPARGERGVPGAGQAGQPEGRSLLDIYTSYFDCRAATTAGLMEESFRLRYQVYCVEHPYEDPASNPGGLETDAYDLHSVHSLLVHRPSGAYAGTVRLILPEPEKGAVHLPIRTVCDDALLADVTRRVPLEQVAEISRFAVAKAFRRRAEDRGTIAGGLSEVARTDRRRAIPHISLGLMRAIVAMAGANGITHLLAVMEPALLRMLCRLGIHFENLGPLVDYHGRRQPCFCDLDELLSTARAERPDVWEVITSRGELWPDRAEAIHER